MPSPKSSERERLLLRGLDGGDQLLGRLGGEALQLHHLVGGDQSYRSATFSISFSSSSWRTRS